MKFFYLLSLPLFVLCTSCRNGTENKTVNNLSDSLAINDTNSIKVVVGTFLGNETRNYYGDEAPSHLNVVWQFQLGSGNTFVSEDTFLWSGAGWTGQPLLFLEDSVPYLIQGSYDHYLRKINAITGRESWAYEFEDVIKSTGTIWINKKARSYEDKYMVMQGSRQGCKRYFHETVVPSYRAVSLVTGKELWQLNSRLTNTYSRDVDGSSMMWNDTAYIGLENGTFLVFNPDKKYAAIKEGVFQPKIYKELMLYDNNDMITHGGDMVTESSPSILGHRIYIPAGSGHIYGYNLKSQKLDWDFFTGSDINGSAAVTNDSCIIVTIEKQFIEGRGGALKLDPSKPADQAVVWFFPTEDAECAEWLGGIVGSACINDYYNKDKKYPEMSAFIGIDGFLYVVDHSKLSGKSELAFDDQTYYPTPKLLFKYNVGASISTPIIVKNKLIACTYSGTYLFEFNNKGEFKLLDYKATNSIESTPVVYNKHIYVASRDGFLYCFGDEEIENPPVIQGTVSKDTLYPDNTLNKKDSIGESSKENKKEK